MRREKMKDGDGVQDDVAGTQKISGRLILGKASLLTTTTTTTTQNYTEQYKETE